MKLSDLRFHLSVQSSNVKTGPIAVSTSSRATCSPTCPFFENGCYAESGPLLLHWRKVTNGERGQQFRQFLVALRNLPAGRAFRHNQAGDLPHNQGRISRTFIKAMVQSVQHLKAFTYTHHDIKKGENLQLLRFANRNGFTVNASCETEQQVDDAIAAGLPAVMVANSDESRTTWRTPSGNVVLVCPAQRSDSKTCADCMLCHKRGKRVAIAFLAHGTSRKKANAVVSEG
jgi:hypothetical protein